MTFSKHGRSKQWTGPNYKWQDWNHNLNNDKTHSKYFLFYFIGSVTLSDPSNICGRCVEPGIVVRLLCYVNNTGARGGNILIWNTPVSEIESVIILFLVSRLFWTVYICIYICMWLCPFYTIVCDVWDWWIKFTHIMNCHHSSQQINLISVCYHEHFEWLITQCCH